MDTDATDLEVFKEDGVLRLLTPPLDDVDHKTTAKIILFALQAVGTTSAKLECLVDTIYDASMLHDDSAAKLFITLSRVTRETISSIVKQNGTDIHRGGINLACFYWLERCQSEFHSTTLPFLWPSRSLTIVLALFEDLPTMFGSLVASILETMAKTDYLFEGLNFELFTRTCIFCGPTLDETAKNERLTALLDEVSARATSETTARKLMVAGLLAARKRGWDVEGQDTDSDTATHVVTPPESDMRSKEKTQSALKRSRRAEYRQALHRHKEHREGQY